jgi:hypothetical protein
MPGLWIASTHGRDRMRRPGRRRLQPHGRDLLSCRGAYCRASRCQARKARSAGGRSAPMPGPSARTCRSRVSAFSRFRVSRQAYRRRAVQERRVPRIARGTGGSVVERASAEPRGDDHGTAPAGSQLFAMGFPDVGGSALAGPRPRSPSATSASRIGRASAYPRASVSAGRSSVVLDFLG